MINHLTWAPPQEGGAITWWSFRVVVGVDAGELNGDGALCWISERVPDIGDTPWQPCVGGDAENGLLAPTLGAPQTDAVTADVQRCPRAPCICLIMLNAEPGEECSPRCVEGDCCRWVKTWNFPQREG